MYKTLLEICDKNIIKCNADMPVPELLAHVDKDKPFPFVILEENNNPIGFLTAKHLDFAFNFSGCFKNALCKSFVTLSLKRVHASLGLRSAVEDIISSKVDGYVLVNEKEMDVGIVTAQNLFDHFFNHKKTHLNPSGKNELPLDHSLSDFVSDKELQEKFNQVKEANHFTSETMGPMIVYEPPEPIPTSLPYHEITTKLMNSVVKHCNSLYESTYHVSKNDLIGKQKGGDRLPHNLTNEKMLKHITEHNYRGFNLESQEKDSDGNDLWFSNDAFLEIDDNKIVRVWVSKQDITPRKKFENASWLHKERFTELFQHSIDSIFIIDVLPNEEFRFARINPTCEKTIGISNQDIRKLPISELFNEETGSQMLHALSRCKREGHSIRVEDHLTFPAGTAYFSTTLVPIHCAMEKIVQIIGVAVDVSQQKIYENKIKHLNWSLLALNNGIAAIARASSENELLQTCCQSITSGNEHFPLCGILDITNDPKQPFKINTLSGNGVIYDDDELNFNRLLGQECILETLTSLKSQFQNIAAQNKPYKFLSPDAKDEIEIRSVLAMPLSFENKISFLFVVYSSTFDSFTATETRMFEELGNNILLGVIRNRIKVSYEKSVIERDKQSRKLEVTFRKTLGALGSMLEHRDAYTAGHQKRVADLAAQIARRYGLDEYDVNTIYLAASVHDIGKITVPAEILSKPSRLTNIEFEIIKIHPEAGYQVLKDIDFPGPIAEIVHQHHEYLDGSGYPLGLKGEQILLGSKILTVADIIEAMSSHRPYRPALGIDLALKEIKKMRGVKLDPKAVDICVDLFENQSYQFPVVDSIHNDSILKNDDISRLLR